MYRRCPSCQRVGLLGYRRGGVRDEPATRKLIKAPMPPEYRCHWCDEFSPRIQGDEIDLDDPTVDRRPDAVPRTSPLAGDPLLPQRPTADAGGIPALTRTEYLETSPE